MQFIQSIKEMASLLRDIGLIIGIPILSLVFYRLYKQYIDLLKERNEFLKETQFDRALQLIKSQKNLYEIERVGLEKDIENLRLNLSNKETTITELQNTSKRQFANELTIKNRLKQLKDDEYHLENKRQAIEQLSKIYNEIFSDLEFIGEFKRIFFADDQFSYFHYGGWNKSLDFYRGFAQKLKKLDLATYSISSEDDFEPSIYMDLNENGVKLKELLFKN